ncbi:hypothetical protein AAFC00_002500 [Neodothiora populina]|uniref:Protein EFR3 n=1 Tax=Neodothiora populina TaxID=2781224 RepID=A0ABR3P7A1_9PEZI
MHALRQKCRPKHQLLILKCYPKLPKNTTATEEIKPNSSELSYLLYYASARRSKLTKVGTFLEKKTEHDLYKGRTPAVLVTLQILAAFLNSHEIGGGKEGFGLFAPYVLRILKEVLTQGANVDLVDGCLPVWTSLCCNQDHATLAGDAEYRGLFAGVVHTWAEFAAKRGGQKTLGRLTQLSASDEIRLRKDGLEAMKAVAENESLNSEAGKHMDIVMDVILQNIWAEDGSYLIRLNEREMEHNKEIETATTRGRPSVSMMRTKTNEEGDARAAGGTAADADKIAEESAGLLALRCLNSIFNVENRAQIRTATSCLLTFISEQPTSSSRSEKPGHAAIWATTLVKMVCNCAPVQDRFVVLFTAVETLIRTPVTEDRLDKQLVLAGIIGQVLSSNINLIGLSIMDILLGLVQHVLLILQIGTRSATLNGDDIAPSSRSGSISSPTTPKTPRTVQMEVVKTASPARVQLLAELRQCIASLATHVYYTDQISDMVSAILLRLKPSLGPTQNPSITASAIENPDNAAAEVASNASLKERPNIDGFFSFDTAREVALNVVIDIMKTAHSAHVDDSVNRNPIPVGVWEGTQWLIRDTSSEVRRTYVDALCTWLELETIAADFKLENKVSLVKNRKENAGGEIARRAVSNASARHRGSKKGRSTFLQLLHLAIYEQALQRAAAPDADGEFLLLHLLLTELSAKLGINAVRTGLPMMFRMQEDIQRVSSVPAKVRLGGLVHGYFAALIAVYKLDNTFIGTEIKNEILRREGNNLWLPGIQVPPMQVTQIERTSSSSLPTNSEKSLKLLEHRQQFVDSLADAISDSLSSPPSSPPASPNRTFSLPMLGDPTLTKPSHLNPSSASAAQTHGGPLPDSIKEELDSIWSRESLLAAIAASAPKSVSLSGSRTGGAGLSGSTNFGSRTDMLRGSGNGVMLGDHRTLLASHTFPMTKSNEGSPTRTGSAGKQGSGATGGVRRAPTARSPNGARGPSRLQSRSPGANGASANAMATALSGAAAGGRRASASTNGGYGTRSTRTSSIVGAGGVSRIDELKRALATGSAVGGAGGAGLGRLGGSALDYSDEGDDDDDSMVENDEYPESSFGDALSDAPGESGSGPVDQPALTDGAPTLDTPLPIGNSTASAIGAGSSGDRGSLPDWMRDAVNELNAEGGNITVNGNGNTATNKDGASPQASNGLSNENKLLSPQQPSRLETSFPPAPSTLSPKSAESAALSPASTIDMIYQQYNQRPQTANSRRGVRSASGHASTRHLTISGGESSSSSRKDLGALLDSVGLVGDESNEYGSGGSDRSYEGGEQSNGGIEGRDGRVTPPY